MPTRHRGRSHEPVEVSGRGIARNGGQWNANRSPRGSRCRPQSALPSAGALGPRGGSADRQRDPQSFGAHTGSTTTTDRGPMTHEMTLLPETLACTAAEALMWGAEADPSLRFRIVAVLELDGVPDWTVLRDRVDRLTRLGAQAPPSRRVQAAARAAPALGTGSGVRPGPPPAQPGAAGRLGRARCSFGWPSRSAWPTSSPGDPRGARRW